MDKLIEMLRRHEGVEKHVYLDTEGLETIGVGRNVSKTGLGLSDDEVNYLLQNDISRVIKELSGAPKARLSDRRKATFILSPAIIAKGKRYCCAISQKSVSHNMVPASNLPPQPGIIHQ